MVEVALHLAQCTSRLSSWIIVRQKLSPNKSRFALFLAYILRIALPYQLMLWIPLVLANSATRTYFIPYPLTSGLHSLSEAASLALTCSTPCIPKPKGGPQAGLEPVLPSVRLSRQHQRRSASEPTARCIVFSPTKSASPRLSSQTKVPLSVLPTLNCGKSSEDNAQSEAAFSNVNGNDMSSGDWIFPFGEKPCWVELPHLSEHY
jgi:hypothetical protein